MTARERSRDLTYEERAVWGTCPVCGAVDGQRCIGYGNRVHLGRLDAAPKRMVVSFE